MPSVMDPVPRTLSELGLDEAWLEQWLQADPKRLGLGSDVRIVRAQLTRPAGSAGGRLDLQAVDEAIEDRVYDIELMRGELDADHGFRALDYWAREQAADEQDREHYPVIVAERIKGSRYWLLLQTLARSLALVALEVRCLEVDGKPAVWLEAVVLPEDLQQAPGGALKPAPSNLIEADWKAKTTTEFWSFLEKFRAALTAQGLKHTTVWSAKSYVGLWKSSRCWCPIWPRKDASGRIYLPVPAAWGDVSENEPSAAFEETKAALAAVGIKLAWAWKYNGGFNPLALTLEAEDLGRECVRQLLEQTWNALP